MGELNSVQLIIFLRSIRANILYLISVSLGIVAEFMELKKAGKLLMKLDLHNILLHTHVEHTN